MRLLLAALLAGSSYPALAQSELTLISPAAVRAAFEQLLPGFEQKSGYKIKATFGSGGGTRQQIARGEPCDVAIMQEPYDDVLASGNVVVNTATPLASIVLGFAVRQGAPKPSISTADELKRTLLAANFVAYADPKGGAAAGAKFDEALHTLGIAAQMEPKLKRTANNSAALQVVARGEAEIGVSFVSEMNTPGSEILGPFPSSVSAPARVVGFVSSHAKDPAAAKALLQYLSSAEAAAVYKATRLMPVR